MKTFIAIILLLVASTGTSAKDDDFKTVVKMIEQFYQVKHQGIPFLAKAGMKVATTAARIKGGQAKRIAEAGSIKLAVFENQEFNGDFIKFRTSLNGALNTTWSPLIQTLSAPMKTRSTFFCVRPGEVSCARDHYCATRCHRWSRPHCHQRISPS